MVIIYLLAMLNDLTIPDRYRLIQIYKKKRNQKATLFFVS